MTASPLRSSPAARRALLGALLLSAAMAPALRAQAPERLSQHRPRDAELARELEHKSRRQTLEALDGGRIAIGARAQAL